MTSQELLSQLQLTTKEITFTQLSEAHYSLCVKEEISLELVILDKYTLLLHALVVKLNEEQGINEAEMLLKRLLERSFTHAKLSDEHLSLDQDANDIVLYKRIATKNSDCQEAVSAVEDFLNHLDYWQKVALL